MKSEKKLLALAKLIKTGKQSEMIKRFKEELFDMQEIGYYKGIEVGLEAGIRLGRDEVLQQIRRYYARRKMS